MVGKGRRGSARGGKCSVARDTPGRVKWLSRGADARLTTAGRDRSIVMSDWITLQIVERHRVTVNYRG